MVRIRPATSVAVLLALSGCFSGKGASAPATSSANEGQVGQYYFVNLFQPPVGGIIASSETPTPRIKCGASSLGTPAPDENGVLQYVPVFYDGANVCGAKGQTRYEWGEQAVLTATPAEGYAFYSWAGDCSGTDPCTLTAGADKRVTAVFRPNGSTWIVRVNKDGGGLGTVSMELPDHPTVTCGPGSSECAFVVPATDPSTVATFTVQPDVASHFVAWSGACAGPDACILAIDGVKSIGATFELNAPGGTTVDAGGATVASPTGVTVEVPPTAVATSTSIAITVAENPPPLPTDIVPLGVEPVVYQFEPKGQVFVVPVKVRLPVPAGVTNACIYWEQPNLATVGESSAVGSTYECIGGTLTGDGFIETEVSHFSAAFVGPPSTTRTIQGIWFNTYLAGVATITNAPVDLSMHTVAAWLQDGTGGYTRLPGQGFANGTFRIGGVPEGRTVIVQVGPGPGSFARLVTTSASSIDMGQTSNGFPGLTEVANSDPMPVDIRVDGLVPYQPGDEINLFSARSDTWAMGAEGFALPPGSTSFAIQNLRAARQPVNPMSVIDGSRASTVLTQLSGAMSGGSLPYLPYPYLQFRKLGRLPGLSVAPWLAPVPYHVAMEDIGIDDRISLDWDIPAFVSAVQPAGGPPCNLAQPSFQVVGQPGQLSLGIAPWERKRPYMKAFFPAASGRVVTGDMPFGGTGPTQGSWGLAWTTSVACNRSVAAPAGYGNVFVSSSINMLRAFIEPSADVALDAPDLSPVGNVRINGLPLQTPQADLPDGSIVMWDPPAIGIPDGYTVIVRHHLPGNVVDRTAILSTTNNWVAIPPGILTKGDVYSFNIHAEKGSKLARPNRMYLPVTRASQATPWFTVSSSWSHVGGSIRGLRGAGLVLSMPGQPFLFVEPGSGGFTFAQPVASGSPYAVTVAQQPTNPPQTCTVSSGAGTVGATDVTSVLVTCRAPEQPSDCGDLAEFNIGQNWTYVYAPGPNFSTAMTTATAAPARGARFVRFTTTAAFDFGLVYRAFDPIDASAFEQLRFSVRSNNPNILVGATPWQGNYPVVVLQDAAGGRAIYTPTTNLMPWDGATWVPITVPLVGGPGWMVQGSVNRASIVRVEIHADTWEWNAYTVDVDALSFERPGTVCP